MSAHQMLSRGKDMVKLVTLQRQKHGKEVGRFTTYKLINIYRRPYLQPTLHSVLRKLYWRGKKVRKR